LVTVLVTVLVTGLGVVGLWLGVVGLWLGVLGLDGVTLRLGGDRLAIALWTALPQPAVRHPIRTAVKRKRP
jgi:hypothetical protein